MSIKEIIEDLNGIVYELEKELAAKATNSEMVRYEDPYINDLQIDHPCCQCGAIQPRGKKVVIGHMDLRVGDFWTSQFIVWCNQCWKDSYGHANPKLKDMSV